MKGEILLQVEGLCKYFPVKSGFFSGTRGYVKAVDGLSFDIRQGETFGLVGESGCGKTTTGRVILNLLKPTKGNIYFEGCDMACLSHDEMQSLRRHMQIIFQDPYSSLSPRMKVRDIVTEPLAIHKLVAKKAIERRAIELLELVGLDPNYIHRYPHEFSGGQRQRIGIARALALNPKLIVCDEAVSALDVSVQSQIINLLEDLQKRFGLTYLFIAHDLRVVKHISDRIGVMYLGKLVEMADTDALYACPRHPYTQALFSAITSVDSEQTEKRIILEADIPSPTDPPTGCRFHTRCIYAQDACRQVEPKFEEESTGHFVACHRK